MINRSQKQAVSCSELQTGSLLISTPVNSKFNNSKLLILVTHHSEVGTTGIILNKPLTGKKIVKHVNGSSEPFELQYGGPDYSSSESYLIIYPSIKNGWKDSIYWSSDFKDLLTIIHFMSEYNIQYGAYKGCIRWKPEELENDLLKKHWWLTNSFQVNSVFQTGNSNWNSYAKKHGGYFSKLVDSDIPILYS